MDFTRKNIENIEVHFENVRPPKHKFDGEGGLREFVINELKSAYYFEKAMLRSFPKIIKNSCSLELIDAMTRHHEETKLQVIRIENAFVVLNESIAMERCFIIESLLNSIDNVIEDTKFGVVRDGGIILAMQRLEHFEIGTYSILATYLENLGESKVSHLLEETINEEKVTGLRLSKIAQTIRFYADT